MVESGVADGDWGQVDLDPSLGAQLVRLGFHSPTALQTALLPAIASENDVIMEAPLGAGRTLAIAIAVVELVSECEPGDAPVALILSSSDERCDEIAAEIERCGSTLQRSGHDGVRIALGGAADDSLSLALDVVIGTPERINTLASTEKLAINALEMVVIDDADDLVVGDECHALTELVDAIEPDRQRVILPSALLAPLSDLFEPRLTNPRRPQLPATEPVRIALPQLAFAVSSPTPDKVALLPSLLGVPSVIAIVPAALTEEFSRHTAVSATPVEVMAALTPGPYTKGAAVVCTQLPTDTEEYANLLTTATEAGCASVVLFAAPANRQHLRALGKAGGVQLNASPFPTDAAIGTRQIMKLEELLTDQLSKVSSQPTPRFLASVHRLSTDYDVADIAAAALELAHQALQREIEPGEDIPLLLRQKSTTRPTDRRQSLATSEGSAQRRKGGDRRTKETEPGMIRLFVAAGYNYGVRPGDIVGAFAGESGLSGKEIGNIDIRESFTLVEVPEKLAEDVIDAMQTGTIKGRQIEVRRERY